MGKRFGRNQKRKLRTTILALEMAISMEKDLARQRESRLQEQMAETLRDQLSKGVIPLEVEHFLTPDRRSLIIHAIFDGMRANLHYQHELTPNDLKIQRDREERERFGSYLGRAIADRIADAYAGREDGSSKGRTTHD